MQKCARTRRRACLAAVALAVVASACGSDADTAIQTEPAPTAAPATAPDVARDAAGTATSAEVRPAVLELRRETLDGPVLDVDQFAGRDVLVWFWAPW